MALGPGAVALGSGAFALGPRVFALGPRVVALGPGAVTRSCRRQDRAGGVTAAGPDLSRQKQSAR